MPLSPGVGHFATLCHYLGQWRSDADGTGCALLFVHLGIFYVMLGDFIFIFSMFVGCFDVLLMIVDVKHLGG